MASSGCLRGKDAEKDKAKQARSGVDVEKGRRKRPAAAGSSGCFAEAKTPKGQGERGTRRRALREGAGVVVA